jgi:AraC-like DNA-binding protein
LNNERYIPQTAYLKNVIRSIWQTEGAPGFQNETILPKGNAEIIFNFNDEAPIRATIDNKQFHLGKCFVNGFNTCPIQTQLPRQHVLFGIEFHLIAIKKLFGIPASEFTNMVVDPALLHPSFNSLWHILAAKKTFNERVAVITTWIEQKAIGLEPREQFLTSFLANDLQQTASVTGLAKSVCYSTRQLSRKIYELTSLNTEDVLLYKKYLRSLQLIQHSHLPLTEIAYESHFSDQSHFIRSFKTFAQITPGEYRQSKSDIPGHIFENVR